MKMTYLWLLQLAAGLSILVLSLIHMASIHLRVVLRFLGVESAGAASGNTAGNGWPLFLVLLSAAVLVHGLIGLRQTVSELTPAVSKMRLITWAIAAGGFILLIGATGLPAAMLSR